MTTVVIVDDHSIFRSGLRSDLGPAIDVVGEAADVDSAVRAIAELRPDVVLLDVHLPGGAGGGGAEVITAGEVAGIASASLSGAAREAMLNAARHAGGEVTVFVEATPGAIDVFVRDHGPGFDAAGVPDGRLGIRESIVGRMARAGGTATVTSDDTGTEVQLHLGRGARS